MTPRAIWLSPVLLCTCILAACGGSKGSANHGVSVDAGTPADGGVAIDFSGPGNPISISVSLDPSRAAQAMIPLSGGVITATGKDGTRFTLTIPKDALFEAQMITLTPVVATAGRPIAPGAAVQLDPDGLRLFKPATLLIEPGTPIPLADQVGVGWHSNGQDVHLEPLDLDKKEISLQIMHFSDDGTGPIPIVDNHVATQMPLTNFRPQDLENFARDLIAQLINAERKARQEHRPGDPNFFEKLAQIMKAYYNAVIEPLMKEAETDCTKLHPNAMKGISFARQAAILGILETEAQAVMASALKGADNCWQAEKKQCRDPKNATRTQDLTAKARQLVLFGGKASLDDIPLCAEDQCSDPNPPAGSTRVCWVGTASHTFASGRKIEANVEWIHVPNPSNPRLDPRLYYRARGTVTVSDPKCSFKPATKTFDDAKGDTTGGLTGLSELTLNLGPALAYEVRGTTMWSADVTCTSSSGPQNAGGDWLLPVAGAVSADGKTIKGTDDTFVGMHFDWNFRRP